MKQTEIKIPKGCKATMYQDEDKIVIEYEESPKFKRGDFVYWSGCLSGYSGIVIIKKDCLQQDELYYFAHLDKECSLSFNCHIGTYWRSQRLATDTERQQLIDALHEAGKDFDFEKMEIVDFVWMPKHGEPYYTPDVYEEDLYSQGTYYGDDDDLLVFNRGLGCKTEEEAIKRAKQMLGIK